MKRLALLAALVLIASPAFAQATNTFPSTGDAGIGTTSPNALLQITGVDAVANFLAGGATNLVRIVPQSSQVIIEATNAAQSAYAPLFLNGSTVYLGNSNTKYITLTGGEVGIGTTSPAYTLDVQGTAGSTLSSNGHPVINKINVQKFTSGGTYTPTAGMVYALVEAIGGGGGGAGAPGPAAGAGSGGGGGAGGAYARGIKTGATIGSSQTVTVGAGGSGGATSGSQNGGSGGSSSLGTLISAGGGGGGVQLNTSCNTVCQTGTPGSGGSPGGTYDYGVPGQSGSYAMAISGWQAAIGGAGGTSGAGSAGGATAMPGSASGTAITGATPSGYGGGGGGGATSAGGAIGGGAGAGGIVVITEYISD